jgi:hypothetical protein
MLKEHSAVWCRWRSRRASFASPVVPCWMPTGARRILCAERLPHPPSDFLHGAACHVCLVVSETSCERGNRFLDRRFVVPIDDPKLALFPETV